MPYQVKNSLTFVSIDMRQKIFKLNGIWGECVFWTSLLLAAFFGFFVLAVTKVVLISLFMALRLDLRVLNIDGSVSLCCIMSTCLCSLLSITALYLIPVPLKETFELINKVCSTEHARRLKINLSLCNPFRYIMSLSYLGRERVSSTAWGTLSVGQRPWWGESL